MNSPAPGKDPDAAFAAMFEPHGDGYLVQAAHGGVLFTAAERDALITRYRKGQPSRIKILVATLGTLAGSVILVIALINLQFWLAGPPKTDTLLYGIVAIFLIAPAALLAGLLQITLRQIGVVRREAARRPAVTPPRPIPTLWQRLDLPVLTGLVTIGGPLGAIQMGWASPAWPWIAVWSGIVVALIVLSVLQARDRKRGFKPRGEN